MKFTPDEILQDLRDEGYEVDWIITTNPMTSTYKPTPSKTGIRVRINMDANQTNNLNRTTFNSTQIYRSILPLIEEVVDRFESNGDYLHHIRFAVSSRPGGLHRTIYYNIEEPLKDDSWENDTLLFLQFEEEKRVIDTKTRFQKVKSFLGFNEAINRNRDRHTDKYLNDFQDIIQDLEDDFECKWDVENDEISLLIFNVDARPMTMEKVLPYLEEIINRSADIDLKFDCIYVGGHEYSMGQKYTSIHNVNGSDIGRGDQLELIFKKVDKVVPEKTRLQKVKSFFGFNESLILETVKFNKQPKKKGAKTDVYNVVNGDNIIGQVKWSSRMRGYGFLPTQDCEKEVKEFASELMKKWRIERKKNKPKKSKD